MKKISIFVLTILYALSLSSCAASQSASPLQKEPASETELIISAAASLTDITKELADAYKKHEPQVTITFTYGSSGSLQTQIEEGAPADIFISAAKKQMNALADKGLIYQSSKDLLINGIALIVPSSSTAGIESFEDLGTDKVNSIALGDPATTPAGQYGLEVLTGLGIEDIINGKVNLGSDVRQVLTWVEMGETDCGIVFMTDALSTEKVKVAAVAPEGSHTPAIYPVGIIETSEHKEEAGKFVDFLYTDEAKALFEKSGFKMAL